MSNNSEGQHDDDQPTTSQFANDEEIYQRSLMQSKPDEPNKKVKFAYSTRNIKNPLELGQFDEDDIENIAS